MATETWLQKLWKQLVVQYESTDPAEMAVMMKRAMTDDNSSVLYRVQSVKINSHYEGLVNTRPAIQRKLEHDKCIVDHKFRPEKRYAFMHKHGGAATWWYTPIVHGGKNIVVPTSQLTKMENTRIKQTQQCLNNINKSKSRNKPRTSRKKGQAPTVERCVKSTKPYTPTPIVFECEGYKSTPNGMEKMLTGDVETLFIQCVMLVVHTSRLQYRLTTLQREFGASLYEARTSLGDTFKGKLKNLLVWARSLPRC